MSGTLLRAALSIAAGAAVLVLSACPPPLSSILSSRLNDKTPPVVTVSAPGNNSPYTQTVTVQASQNKPGKLKVLAYTVSGTLGLLTSGTVALSLIAADGSFSFQFSTLTFSGPIAVTVEATDWNDNVGQATVTLTSPGSSLSSFAVTPGNKSASLSWEPVSGASYTVYYTTNGTLPTQSYGSVATPTASPYVVAGLKNGAMCTFLLRARTAGGTDYWSGYIQVIPLSALTLAPMVSADYRQIRLEWNAIDGASQFIVCRDTDPAGAFPAYSGVLTGTSFADTNVVDNTWYYYKVRPALAGSITSASNAAQTFLYSSSQSAGITNMVLSAAGYKLKATGTYAFATAGTQLWVVDVSNPKVPVMATMLSGFTDAQDIALYGGYAYVADGAGGVRVVSIANPLAPSVIATIDSPAFTNAVGVSIAGSYLFVLDSTTTIRAFNLGTPSSPTAAGSYSGSALSEIAATVTSGTLYVYAGTTTSLLKLSYNGTSFSGPSTLSMGSYQSNLVCVAPTTTASDFLYVVGQATSFLEPPPPYALMVVKLSNFTVSGTSAASKGYLKDAVVSGTSVYVADGTGLQLIDVSSSTAPAMKQFWDNPGTTDGVTLNPAASFALVTTVLGFQTVDLALPTAFPSDGPLPVSGGVNGAAVRGSDAFITAPTGTPKFKVADVSNPASPNVVAGAVLAQTPVGVALSGPYAFVAESPSLGFEVVDIGTPLSPTVVGSVSTLSGSSNAIAVKGDYVYLATSSGMQIFDVSDPSHPAAIGLVDSDGGGIHGVALRGSYAYIDDGTYFQPTNVKILDVSNPSSPTLVAAVPGSGANPIQKIALYGDWAFFTAGVSGGITAININPSDGNYLTKYGPCTTGSGPGGLFVFGSYAYVADSSTGLVAVDITDPTGLATASPLNTKALSAAVDVTVSGKYAYVSDGQGLDIVALY